VNKALRDLLDTSGGLLHYPEVPVHVLAEAVRSGRVRRILPEVYVDAALTVDHLVMARAAVRYTQGRGALSHTSALRLWRLPVPDVGPTHVTVAGDPGLRSRGGVRVHRRHGFRPEPPHAVLRGGLPVTRLEHAVIESWPLLNHNAQRAPAITAVAERLTTPDRLTAALQHWPRLPGRKGFRDLVGKLKRGCRSELEIWGYDHIFRDIPGLRRQVPVRLRQRTVYLDVFDPTTRTNFELDGARYHVDRERDLRRDAALATKGITVVRYTHDRLTGSPEDVRAEVSAILTAAA
jgi:very-short-patch-repair endonuclease